MPLYHELSDVEKGQIIGMMEAGVTHNDVARHLNRSRWTVQMWWKRWQTEGHVDHQPRSGRPRLILKNSEHHVRL